MDYSKNQIIALNWFRKHVCFNVDAEIELKYHSDKYPEKLVNLIKENMPFVNSIYDTCFSVREYLGVELVPETDKTELLFEINRLSNMPESYIYNLEI